MILFKVDNGGFPSIKYLIARTPGIDTQSGSFLTHENFSVLFKIVPVIQLLKELLEGRNNEQVNKW